MVSRLGWGLERLGERSGESVLWVRPASAKTPMLFF